MLKKVLVSIFFAALIAGCQKYSQRGEVVYLTSEDAPTLQVPADLASTTAREPLYPVPEGERRTPADGPIDPTPPPMSVAAPVQ